MRSAMVSTAKVPGTAKGDADLQDGRARLRRHGGAQVGNRDRVPHTFDAPGASACTSTPVAADGAVAHNKTPVPARGAYDPAWFQRNTSSSTSSPTAAAAASVMLSVATSAVRLVPAPTARVDEPRVEIAAPPPASEATNDLALEACVAAGLEVPVRRAFHRGTATSCTPCS